MQTASSTVDKQHLACIITFLFQILEPLASYLARVSHANMFSIWI